MQSVLGRLGGKRSFQQTDEASGQQIRDTISEGNQRLINIRDEIPLCPFCENLFEEAELLADVIEDSLKAMILKNYRLVRAFQRIKSSMKKAFVSNTLLEVQMH